MPLGLWILFVIGVGFIVCVASLKDEGPKSGCVIVSIFVLFMGMMIAYHVNEGIPLDSLPAGGTYQKLFEVQDGEFAVLKLIGVRSKGYLEETLFCRIERWRLLDKNENPITKIPDHFEVVVIVKKITKQTKEGTTTEKLKFYCLIPI